MSLDPTQQKKKSNEAEIATPRKPSDYIPAFHRLPDCYDVALRGMIMGDEEEMIREDLVRFVVRACWIANGGDIHDMNDLARSALEEAHTFRK